MAKKSTFEKFALAISFAAGSFTLINAVGNSLGYFSIGEEGGAMQAAAGSWWVFLLALMLVYLAYRGIKGQKVFGKKIP